MPGPTEITDYMSKYDFQKLIDFDEVYEFRLRYRRYLTQETFYSDSAFSTHFFKNGVEVGYYHDCMGNGLIFETPRVWGWTPEQKACHFLVWKRHPLE